MWQQFRVKLTVYNCIYLILFTAMNQCALIRFEEFYSQSFIPNGLEISHRLENNISIYYNVTALMAFPGKILFSIFVRKLGNERGEKSLNMLKYKNLDFCKTIELVKNFTSDNFNGGDTLVQSTFINSCPLTRGFYYITNGTVDDEVVPLYFTSGRYLLLFELVQVFDEISRMVNIKAKCVYESRW